MSATIISNFAGYSDNSGHGNQSHLLYAANQGRWWAFNFDTKTATVVKCYVSSSSNVDTSSWSAGTDSPSLTQALQGTEQRNLGVVGFANGSTDVAHLSVSTGTSSGSNAQHGQHIRATFTGASSITWETWNDSNQPSANTVTIRGTTIGVSTDGTIHEINGVKTDAANGTNGDPNGRLSTNADTGATWTNGFGTQNKIDDSMAFKCGSSALAKLASAAMLGVFENASVSDTQSSGLRWNTFTSGSWPNNTGNADVGIGTSTQNDNDWCLCGIDTTHIFAVRRDSSNSYLIRKFDGSSWSSKTAPGTQAHRAGSGIFLAQNGTDMWMFVIDSGDGSIKYNKYTVATDSWGGWLTALSLEINARNCISGFPGVGNNQIGVIYTEANGSNFDLNVVGLSIASSAVAGDDCDVLIYSPRANW